MDSRSISQNSDLTERSHRRRLSSILKAPRSPLKDLGSGNELCQEPAIEKRRKSSRRVSFAETIRVFTPELQSTGSADKENEDFGTGDFCNNINKETVNTCGIAGMDTLLHGPIQVPGHNADWNYSDSAKDRTIFFSSDNDMDMTASNTVTIHGLSEEKTKKIDTSQFLASLKSQNSAEVAKNKDVQLSVGVEKGSELKLNIGSSTDNKIKFSDFLASLGSEKSKATNNLDDADKENIFPFAPTHFYTQDNTGNVTRMFREQDDGLDLTKCHTTNIDSFFPMYNREISSHLVSTADNGNSQNKRFPLSGFTHLSSAPNNDLNRPASNDQTVFMEDDMDITCSHTTRIRQSTPAQHVQPQAYRNEIIFPSDKTIIFADENEMELTRDNSVFLNRNPNVPSTKRKERAFCVEHTTILPQGEDMDITKSHTVAIDGLMMDQLKPQAMSHSAVCNSITKDGDINDISCVGVKRLSSGLSLSCQKIPNKSLNDIDGPDVRHPQNCSEIHTTYASKLEDKPGEQAKRFGHSENLSTISSHEPTEKAFTSNTKSDNSEKTIMFAFEQDDMELTKSHTIAIDGKHLQQLSKNDNKSYFSGLKLTSVSNKTILFSTDGDDMELTQSHTVCIDQKALSRDNRSSVSSGYLQRRASVSSGRAEITGRDFSDQSVKENTALLNKVTGATSSKRKSIMNATNCLSNDMEMTVVETETFRKSPLSDAREGDKTVVFTCDQQDMEITRSHTVSIDSKVLCERLPYNTHNANSNYLDLYSAVLKCPNANSLQDKERDGYTAGKMTKMAGCINPSHDMSSEESRREPCTTLQNNTIVFRSDQDDMDITKSHTVAIKNTLLYGNAKINISVPCVPSALKSSAADKTVFEDDMELTKSHTMIIDERNAVGSHNRSASVKSSTLAATDLDNVVTKPNAICREMETAPKMSRRQFHNETVHQEGDMEMTNVNAGLLIASERSQAWNKGNPSFESFRDKTIYLCDQDNMDMTRAHTVAIENKVVAEVDNAYFKSMLQNSTDMDITLSNKMFDREEPENDLQFSKSKFLLSTGDLHLDNMGRDEGNNLVIYRENGNHLEKTTPVSTESQDKTLFLCEQNDMDITRSHTTAIESKILEDKKSKNVISGFQYTKKLTNKTAGLDLTNNAVNMVDSVTSMNRICSKDEDMDITKSNTVFIDHISDELHNKAAYVSDVLPKRKSVSSCPKSSASSNETVLLVCNMEETNANVHLTESLENKFSFDKTVCNQGDMEMTKSHTVAIESKLLEAENITYPGRTCTQVSGILTPCNQGSNVCDEMEGTRPQVALNTKSVPPSVSEQDLSMPPQPKVTMTFSVTEKESELTKLQGNGVLLPGSDETMFLNEEHSMDITKAHTAAVEVNYLDNSPSISSTSIDVVKVNTEVVNGVKSFEAFVEIEQNLNKPIEKLERSRRKSYARSLSLLAKSEILEGLGNNELTPIHTIPVDEVSLLKTNSGPCIAETDLILDNESDKFSAGSTDRKSKGSEQTSFRKSILATDQTLDPIFSNNSVGSSDCKVESLEENGVPDNRSDNESGFKSQWLGMKSESLKMTSELTQNSRDNVGPEEQKSCILPVEDLLYTHQKDPEVSLEKEKKKTKLKGKRVSFHFPEKEVVTKDVMLEQVTEPSVSQREKYDQVENQDSTVHVSDQISDFKSDFINQTSVMGTELDTENLEDNTLPKNPEVSKFNVGFPEGISSNVDGLGISTEFSPKSRNRRRSIADLQLKIKSLSKMSSHHTAPVSSLVDQLPATSQISYPSGSEQVLANAEVPNTENIQQSEPNNEKSIKREKCLPNRLSIKMFQPKLPNKRASSTSAIPEPVVSSVSEAQLPNDQTSKTFLKTLSVLDDGQCIDKEMLPACPDDQEINSIFHFEVPEGAWEELCEEEALQQNLNISNSQPKDSMNGQKRVRDMDDDAESQKEKRARWNEDLLEKDEAQISMAFKGSDKSSRSDYSAHHASKTMEQTYYSSSSSQDSRGDGMSVELSSQQYSQMDSQLPWDAGCEQSLWQKFQDGTITVQEFFVLLRIRILIQKPRYSELPSKRGMNEDQTASEILLDQYVYQPKLQVYEEECHTLYQTIEELKVSTELQHKPLVQINSLLWEAMRMCSENELMYFGMTLKNMKSLYSKKSKRIAHEEKVSTYTKLLHTAQTQWEQLQARLSETDQLLKELDDCISSLEIETERLTEECRNENPSIKDQGCMQIQAEIDSLKSQEQHCIRESLELEERKQKVLGQLGCLQEEARVTDKHLQEPSFTEWELVKWTDKDAAFIFLYDSIELSITFGDYIDGENFNNQPCRRISSVTAESQLNDQCAPPSSILVHRLVLQFVEKKGAFHETYTTQNDLPQLLFDLSLVVSRCRLLGEELEYLIKWGAKYNILKTQVQSQEVRLLFSSLAALVKFELIIHLSDTYPTVPLTFTVNNHIGNISSSRVTAIMSKIPVGLWYLKRTVKAIHENLLV